jgi:vacuolar-type H+-ATPase subunit H
MVNDSEQEQYIKSLVKIKEIEERVQKEIEQRKVEVDSEIKELDEDLISSVNLADEEGKQLVDASISTSRSKAETEAKKIITDAEAKSKNITFNFDQSMVREILEILFKGLK